MWIRIRDPGSSLTLDPRSGRENFWSGIWEKHPGAAKLKRVHQIQVDVPDCFCFLFFSEFVSVRPVKKHVGRWRRRLYTHRSGLCCWGFYTAYSPTSYRYRSKHFLGSTLKSFSKAVFRFRDIDTYINTFTSVSKETRNKLKRSRKTVETKVLNFFACWWKDPDAYKNCGSGSKRP